MIPSNRTLYSSADEWLEALQADELWQRKKEAMEAAYQTDRASCMEHYRTEAEEDFPSNDNFILSCWNNTEHDVRRAIQEIWEETSISLPRLKTYAMGMLKLDWIAKKAESDIQLAKKKEEQSQRSIFVPSVNEERIKNALMRFWLVKPTPDADAPRKGELFQLSYEWICAYKLFLDLEWLANTDRAAFCRQIQQWIDSMRTGRIKPCSEMSFKKLPAYIKDYPGSLWKADGERRTPQEKQKLRVLIYIYKKLVEEFTDAKYKLHFYP